MIFCQILKEEKAVRKKELHQGRKKICPFSKAAFLIIKLRAHPLLFYLKIKTSAAVIMKNKVMFQDQGMRILLLIKNLLALKIIAAVDILAED